MQANHHHRTSTRQSFDLHRGEWSVLTEPCPKGNGRSEFHAVPVGQRVSFAPTFIFTEKGREIRRYTGWLPPRAYRAELAFVRAAAAWQRGDAAGAKTLCDDLIRDFAEAPVVPEALYLQGMAGFIAGNKDFAAMRASWERCAREYPTSRFGIHASVIDDAPRS